MKLFLFIRQVDQKGDSIYNFLEYEEIGNFMSYERDYDRIN